jgi:hypothetical protein
MPTAGTIVQNTSPTIVSIEPKRTTPENSLSSRIPIYFPNPSVTAPSIIIDSWSPYSKYFAFWTFNEDQVNSNNMSGIDYTSGILNFWNSDTEEVCQYSYDLKYQPNSQNIRWDSDDKVIVISGIPPRIGTPCEDDFSLYTGDISIKNDIPSSSISSEGNYLAETRILNPANYLAETIILDVISNQPVFTTQWHYVETEGLCLRR